MKNKPNLKKITLVLTLFISFIMIQCFPQECPECEEEKKNTL